VETAGGMAEGSRETPGAAAPDAPDARPRASRAGAIAFRGRPEAAAVRRRAPPDVRRTVHGREGAPRERRRHAADFWRPCDGRGVRLRQARLRDHVARTPVAGSERAVTSKHGVAFSPRPLPVR